MKKVNVTLGIIAAVVLVGAPIMTSLQNIEAAVMRDELRYSGPRASIAVSGNNNIYLTWWDNQTGNNEVFFAGSNDSGKSFGKPINLSNAKGASADSQIAANENNSVYVTWWDNKTGSWEVYSRASTDGGKTFAEAVMLKSFGASPVKGLKAQLPTTISVDTFVAASANNEYVMWWDNRTGNWEVFLARSTDGGKTFADPINISNSPDSRSLGAKMAAQGNNVYISWIDIDRNTGQKQVMFRSSSDYGQIFSNSVIVTNNTTASGL